jgi:hypothetical protein
MAVVSCPATMKVAIKPRISCTASPLPWASLAAISSPSRSCGPSPFRPPPSAASAPGRRLRAISRSTCCWTPPAPSTIDEVTGTIRQVIRL